MSNRSCPIRLSFLIPPSRTGGLRRIIPAKVLHWLRIILLRAGGFLEQELLPRYIQINPGGKVLENRCCSGTDEYFISMNVSGTSRSVLSFLRRARKLPAKISPGKRIGASNVIEGDMFSDDVLSRYDSTFDVVFSRGLIEHFTDPARSHRCASAFNKTRSNHSDFDSEAYGISLFAYSNVDAAADPQSTTSASCIFNRSASYLNGPTSSPCFAAIREDQTF